MADETLRGWNAIADFLSCDVRTAKRWEQYRQLPVHRTRRTPGQGRANVYALTPELEAWRASANNLPESPQEADAQLPEPPEDDESGENNLSSEAFVEPAAPQRARLRWKRIALPAAGTAVAFVVLMTWSAGRLSGRTFTEAGVSGQALHPIRLSTPEDARAQELYLHGSYLFEQRTPETLQQASLDFEASIAASPKYAPAYAGLAKTYALLREYSNLPSFQAYPLARQSAQQAITLDPKLADAHAALGYEEFFWEWDAPRAEGEFKQAIALDPNSSLAHHWYGSMLMHQTRFSEALDQLNQAQMLEPDSAAVLGSRAYAIGLSGRRDEAVDLVQDILTRVPDSAPLHFSMAQLCLQPPRDIPRYLDQMRRFAVLRHSEKVLAVLNTGESAYREHGEEAMWQAMLKAERQLYPDANHPTYFMVELEAVQGLKDAALRDLGTLLRNHDEQMIGIEIDTTLSSLWDDPRFARIASQVGLPALPATKKL